MNETPILNRIQYEIEEKKDEKYQIQYVKESQKIIKSFLKSQGIKLYQQIEVNDFRIKLTLTSMKIQNWSRFALTWCRPSIKELHQFYKDFRKEIDAQATGALSFSKDEGQLSKVEETNEHTWTRRKI